MKNLNSISNEQDVDRANIIVFDEGLPAFEEEKEFFLVPMEEATPFFYLQSVNSHLCFVMSDPFMFFPDYVIDLPESVLDGIGAGEDTSGLMVFSILTVGENLKNTTANLMAPVIINARNRKGIQYVPDKAAYSTRHYLFSRSPDQAASLTGEGC